MSLNRKKMKNTLTLWAVVFCACSIFGVRAGVRQMNGTQFLQDVRKAGNGADVDGVNNTAMSLKESINNGVESVQNGTSIINKELDPMIGNTVVKKKSVFAKIREYIALPFRKAKELALKSFNKFKEMVNKFQFTLKKTLKAIADKGKLFLLETMDYFNNEVNKLRLALEKKINETRDYHQIVNTFKNKVKAEVEKALNYASIKIDAHLAKLPERGLGNCTNLARSVQTNTGVVLKKALGCVDDKIKELMTRAGLIEEEYHKAQCNIVDIIADGQACTNNNGSQVLLTSQILCVSSVAGHGFSLFKGTIANLFKRAAEFVHILMTIPSIPTSVCLTGSIQGMVDNLTVNNVKQCVDNVNGKLIDRLVESAEDC